MLLYLSLILQILNQNSSNSFKVQNGLYIELPEISSYLFVFHLYAKSPVTLKHMNVGIIHKGLMLRGLGSCCCTLICLPSLSWWTIWITHEGRDVLFSAFWWGVDQMKSLCIDGGYRHDALQPSCCWWLSNGDWCKRRKLDTHSHNAKNVC